MSEVITPAEIDEILSKVKAEDIVSRECKHATYSVSRNGEKHDMLSVKEYVTLKDGRRFPTMRFFKDYKRPYWVTKPHFRDHSDKIEFEHLSRLDMFKSSQINLRQDICFRLGRGNPRDPLKVLARSPYVYGLDPGPEVFLKQSYMNRWPDSFVPNKVTVIDCETDMRADWFCPILWSEVNDDEIILYYDHNWCYELKNFERDVLEEYKIALDQWISMVAKKLADKKTGKIPEFLEKARQLPVKIVRAKGHFDLCSKIVQHLHLTQPDIVTGWNVLFDIEALAESSRRSEVAPEDFFSDPRVPKEFRFFFTRRGAEIKKTANGREMRLDPQERWDVVLCTSSWKVQDAMQTYWQLRKAKGKESGGYGLEAVLQRQLGAGKLKFPVDDSSVPPGTSHWHIDMQANHKVRYAVYNIFDSLGLWVLEKKNNDLTSQISALAGPMDYSKFNSQPTINAADMLFTVLKREKRVLCSTSDEMEDENDELTFDRDGWINKSVI